MIVSDSNAEKAGHVPSPAVPMTSAGQPKVDSSRSIIVTVLFFDIVGYTKRPVNVQTRIKKQFTQLLSNFLARLDNGERIILDTGDGAAIGFLQHPEDAMEVAVNFRTTVSSNQHQNYPDLQVRIGIHLGPINVVADMNGQRNMVGDGINDAQRVMSFAGSGQIYVSRAYYDFIARLSHENEKLFTYRGSQKDKHGRAHSVYELVDPNLHLESRAKAREVSTEIKLEPFTFELPSESQAHIQQSQVVPNLQNNEDAALISDVRKLLDIAVTTPADSSIAQAESSTTKKLPQSEPVKPKEISEPIVPVKVAKVIKPQFDTVHTDKPKNATNKTKTSLKGILLLVVLLGFVAAYFILKK